MTLPLSPHATPMPLPTHPLARLAARLNRLLVGTVEAVAALLLVLETGILLLGVIWRYGLDAPLIWSDELAATLFSWLAILGAVVAVQRGEHMRLNALVKRMPEDVRAWLDGLAQLVMCVFVGAIVLPGSRHALGQMAITTPALEIPDGLRAAALPAGALLMLIAAATRLAATITPLRFLGAACTIGLVSAVLYALHPWLLAIGNYNLLIFFLLLVGVCVALAVPIAFAFGVSTLAYLALATHAPLGIIISRMDEGMANQVLLAVPLFILLGVLLELSGLARALIDFMAALLGHLRGGLQYVLLGAMFLVSGISGSKAADMAAVAPALLPEMRKRGVPPEELVALLAASGAMTETIPPSLVLITIGAVCGVSITALFIGGMLPAVVATLGITLVCGWRARHTGQQLAERASWSRVGRTLIIAVPALALPVLIRLAVIEGAATATEVSTVGVAYTLIAALIMDRCGRPVAWRRLYSLLIESASLAGAILLIIGCATAMAWALTQSGFSASLVSLMEQMPGGATGFLLITMLIFTLLGSMLEGIPAIVLLGPLLFPVARALGINDVHYAMVVILAMGIGLFAPPLGVGFYAACAIGKAEADRVMSRVWGYLAVLVVSLAIVTFVPWLSTVFLPPS